MSVQPNAEKIRKLRIELGLSQDELAKDAQCSKRTIENVEQGNSVIPRTVREIAAALGVAPKDLIAENSEDTTLSDKNIPGCGVGNAPRVPPLVVGRDNDMRLLKERLMRPVLGGDANRIIVIHGWAGVGKSTIAAAIAHDAEITAFFPETLWASLGQEPDILAELMNWGRALGSQALRDAQSSGEASTKLGAVLRERRALLIVDDAWSEDAAKWFMIGGRYCATLVTTRLSSVAERLAPTPDDAKKLNVLEESSALELLGKHAPSVVEKHPRECQELVVAIECLPLAIEVAGRLLNTHEKRWETESCSSVVKLLSELKSGARILQEKPPPNLVNLVEETSLTVAALLQKSTDYLDQEARERFAYLAAFASKPATFSLEAMAGVWEVDEEDAQAMVNRLVDHGLLEPLGNQRFWIHSLLVSLACSLCK